MRVTGYVIEVVWDGVDLPSLIGPFESEREANTWARLNTPNGVPVVRALAAPYAEPTRA